MAVMEHLLVQARTTRLLGTTCARATVRTGCSVRLFSLPLSLFSQSRSVAYPPLPLALHSPITDAGYYSYLWSEVFAHDVFTQFSGDKGEDGCFDEEVGKRYRECILNPGATKPGMAMLRAFLGREPNLDAFVGGMAKSKGL